MTKVLRVIFDWSEVWALLIPMFQLWLKPQQPKYLKPVIFYLWAALLLNLSADLLGEYNTTHRDEIISNNPIYNIHSLIRFIFFSYFFILLGQSFFIKFKKVIPLLFLVFLVVDFGFYENFFYAGHISGNLFSAEAFLLLVYCMLFYLSKLKEEVAVFSSGKDFWIVTGLSVYVAFNFFVFLFYVPMMNNPDLANNMWDVHNVAYILLCIFISKAFYASASN